MPDQSANPLRDLLDRIETEAASPAGVPDAAFSAIARKMGDASFVLPDQAAWDDVQQMLEKFEAGDDQNLGTGAVKILSAAANRQAPLLANDNGSYTPQLRAAIALGAAFKSADQYVRIEAAKALGKYGSSSAKICSPTVAARTLRKGFEADDNFVTESVLTAFARVAANIGKIHSLKEQLDGLDSGLRNPNTASNVAACLVKIARKGPKQAAIAINIIDRAFMTPELDSDVYDEGIKALSKIGLLDKESGARAIAAIGDLSPRWQAGRSGRAGLTGALAEIALAHPSVAAQAIDVLFSGLEESFEDNDAWVQSEAVDAVVSIATGLPSHEADIRSRLEELARDGLKDVREMATRALNGIEPAREAARMNRELLSLVNALGSATPPMP